MSNIFKHNPLRDIEPVVPGLSVDVAEVMATHQVMSTGDSTPYSKETEVSEIGHYIGDKIQAAIVAMNIGRSMSQSNPSVSPSAPAPSGAQE